MLLLLITRSARIDVFLGGQSETAKQTPLISGPLHGKILPSESSWAIIRSPLQPPYAEYATVPVQFATHGSAAVGNCYLLLSLPKAYGSCDIWATVLDREYLRQLRPVDSDEDIDEDEDVGNYGKYYQ